jgi:hypothetical protein
MAAAEPSPAGLVNSGAQLAVVAELGVALSAAGVRFWLRGGWAVDFLLGALTRPHEDVDVVAWRRHRPRVRRALTAAGFRVVRETEKQIDFEKQGVDVTFVYLRRAGAGRIVTHGVPEWTWRPDALPPAWRGIDGVACRVVSARQLLEEKEGDPRPPRPKDAESIAALRRLLAAGC